MSGTLSIRNRQRTRRINIPLLRRIALDVLHERLQVAAFDLAIHLVAAPEMARVNWDFLKHEGSTDVITFDHSDEPLRVSSFPFRGGRDNEQPDTRLHGELFICLDDAVTQAREFRTTWQSELVRYVIHGLLHLCGHDDVKPPARRSMKREENRLLKAITKRFSLPQLETRNAKLETKRRRPT